MTWSLNWDFWRWWPYIRFRRTLQLISHSCALITQWVSVQLVIGRSGIQSFLGANFRQPTRNKKRVIIYIRNILRAKLLNNLMHIDWRTSETYIVAQPGFDVTLSMTWAVDWDFPRWLPYIHFRRTLWSHSWAPIFQWEKFQVEIGSFGAWTSLGAVIYISKHHTSQIAQFLNAHLGFDPPWEAIFGKQPDAKNQFMSCMLDQYKSYELNYCIFDRILTSIALKLK